MRARYDCVVLRQPLHACAAGAFDAALGGIKQQLSDAQLTDAVSRIENIDADRVSPAHFIMTFKDRFKIEPYDDFSKLSFSRELQFSNVLKMRVKNIFG